jgi:hypothetical protein
MARTIIKNPPPSKMLQRVRASPSVSNSVPFTAKHNITSTIQTNIEVICQQMDACTHPLAFISLARKML